ncbi:MAG: hypothetical protein LQ347_004771 [Umbilicaria vellea]|nr:MAG: hypothetical protein LQ347_004771 [Umbilicaria vellea]
MTFDDKDLEERFLKGSGPGGQKINKTSSAVQLKHLPSGVVVKCQNTRSQRQNRKIARRLLADKLEFIEKGPESRIALREEKLKRKKGNKRNKALKRFRKLYRQIHEDVEEVEEVDTTDVDTEEVNSEEVGPEKEKEELGEGKRM